MVKRQPFEKQAWESIFSIVFTYLRPLTFICGFSTAFFRFIMPPNHFAKSPFVNFVPSAKRVVKIKLKVHGFDR